MTDEQLLLLMVATVATRMVKFDGYREPFLDYADVKGAFKIARQLIEHAKETAP